MRGGTQFDGVQSLASRLEGGGSPLGLTDVGSIVFPGNPEIRTWSPPHPSRLTRATLCKQERAFLRVGKARLLDKDTPPVWPDGQTAPSYEGAKRRRKPFVPPAPHPSALTGCHLLPREKAFLRKSKTKLS